MHKIYPFQSNASSTEYAKRYKPDPDKATQWLKLILGKDEDDVNKNKSDSDNK